MRIQEYESHALKLGLKPIEVIMERGREVIWFMCLDTRENKQYNLIIYDNNGSALVTCEVEEEEARERINIQAYNGGVTVNGKVMMRAQSLDIKREKLCS